MNKKKGNVFLLIICILLSSMLVLGGCGTNDEPPQEDPLPNEDKTQYKNSAILLPEILYCTADMPVEIYFRNIIAYPLDTVYIQTGTDIAGSTQYSDKWVGTPSAGLYTLVVSLYDRDWDRIDSKRVSVVAKEATQRKEIAALVIGDSTLCSGVETEQMLDCSQNDEYIDLTLLGTVSYSDQNRFEGRSGWSASQYATSATVGDNVNPFYNQQKQCFDFSFYMANQGYDGVDVVFLQLGINDIFNADENHLTEAIEKYISSLRVMIDSIHAYNPSAKVVINPIIPCCQDQDKFGAVYGVKTVWEYMRNMYKTNLSILQTFANATNVYVSYYNACLDLNNQPNDVHPTSDGYTQLGNQMYSYMKAIVN